MGFIIIDEREHKIKENEVKMSAGEVGELVEYSDYVDIDPRANVKEVRKV